MWPTKPKLFTIQLYLGSHFPYKQRSFCPRVYMEDIQLGNNPDSARSPAS